MISLLICLQGHWSTPTSYSAQVNNLKISKRNILELPLLQGYLLISRSGQTPEDIDIKAEISGLIEAEGLKESLLQLYLNPSAASGLIRALLVLQ